MVYRPRVHQLASAPQVWDLRSYQSGTWLHPDSCSTSYFNRIYCNEPHTRQSTRTKDGRLILQWLADARWPLASSSSFCRPNGRWSNRTGKLQHQYKPEQWALLPAACTPVQSLILPSISWNLLICSDIVQLNLHYDSPIYPTTLQTCPTRRQVVSIC